MNDPLLLLGAALLAGGVAHAGVRALDYVLIRRARAIPARRPAAYIVNRPAAALPAPYAALNSADTIINPPYTTDTGEWQGATVDWRPNAALQATDEQLTPTELLPTVTMRPAIRVPSRDALADDVKHAFDQSWDAALAPSRLRLQRMVDACTSEHPIRHYRTAAAMDETQPIDRIDIDTEEFHHA